MSDSLFQSAQAAYAQGQFERSYALCADGLRTQPANAALHNLAAVSAAQRAHFDLACRHAREALGLDPDNDAFALNAALVFERAGHLDEARTANQKLLDRNPTHSAALANLANLARLANDNERALSLYAQALAVMPKDTTLLANRASLLSLMGQHTESIETIEQALALEPNAPDLIAASGDILAAAGHPADAIKRYEQALPHAPDTLTLRLNLAVAYLANKDRTNALAHAQQLEADDPGNRTAAAIRYIAAVQEQDLPAAGREMNVERDLALHKDVVGRGYADLAAFTDALRDEALAHPSLRFEPTSKTTRGGAQSANLLPAAGPAVNALRETIERHVLRYLEQHESDAVSAASAMAHFSLNIWVTVLDQGGHQLPHIHPAGVLSGVFYVAVPDPAAGSIEFGMPPADYGPFDQVPTHTLQPVAGDLLIFPSQFYHRTRAFEHAEQRISIAFDVIPAGLNDDTPPQIMRTLDEAQQRLQRGDIVTAQNLLSTVNVDAPRVDFVRGQLALASGDHDAAVAHFEVAVEKRPRAKQWWYSLGLARQREMNHEAARKALKRCLRIDKKFENARMSLASLHTDLGEADEAVAAYRAVVDVRPAAGRAWYGLALQRVGSLEPPDLARMREALGTQSLNPEDEGGLHFALGRALEHTKEYDEAFRHFSAGNHIKRSQQPFDAAAEQRNTTAICEAFTPAVFEQFRDAGLPSDQPILIVGMPRSGSTLIEQIIASHPDVAAAGETNALWRTLSALGQYLPAGSVLPRDIAKVPAAAWAELGARYLAQLQREAGGNSKHITDKLPFNYTLLGMLRLMLPNAHVIDARRHPMDTCWSCFATSFGVDRGFTNDLTDLGRTYVSYERLMHHWSEVLPKAIYTQHYEDLVRDTEDKTRALIGSLGLTWHDDCLNFHRNKRAVTTSSYAQVRQPIYTSSLARWRRFDAHLQPLRDALGPLANEDDAS